MVGAGSLDEFPRITFMNERIGYDAYNQQGTRDIFDVLKSRVSYHLIRLALAAERIFSHTQNYTRPKLHAEKSNGECVTVGYVDSVIGRQNQLWVLGFLT